MSLASLDRWEEDGNARAVLCPDLVGGRLAMTAEGVAMAYDEQLADRIREAVAAAAPEGHREIAMFGGLCWTVNTHMTVGARDEDLMVHVGTAGVEDALSHGARRATMGERTMGGVVLVSADDLPDAEALTAWVQPAVERARAQPPRPGKA